MERERASDGRKEGAARAVAAEASRISIHSRERGRGGEDSEEKGRSTAVSIAVEEKREERRESTDFVSERVTLWIRVSALVCGR